MLSVYTHTHAHTIARRHAHTRKKSFQYGVQVATDKKNALKSIYKRFFVVSKKPNQKGATESGGDSGGFSYLGLTSKETCSPFIIGFFFSPIAVFKRLIKV